MKKRALSITETSITIGVVAVIGILSVGLFTDGLKGVIANSGVKDVFVNNSKVQAEKTSYASYERDYTGTQIEVQVTGAQGLTQLRRKANNKALSLIDSADFVKNAVEIAYLSRVVEILTGEPYFCVYMDKDTEQHCNEFTKTKYTTSVSSALTIPEKGASNVALTSSDGKNAGAVLSSITVPKDENGYPTLTVEEKYRAIQDLSAKMENMVADKSILVMTGKAASANTQLGTLTSQDVIAQGKFKINGTFKDALSKTLVKLRANRDECECSIFKDTKIFWHWFDFITGNDECDTFVTTSDLDKVERIINDSDRQGYMSSKDYSELGKIIRNDRSNKPSAYEVFSEIKFSSEQ